MKAPADVRVRPATADDGARADLPDVLPDRWHPGGNRRSFVAVRDAAGGPEVLGHARGIDNRFHPDSRVLVLEVHPDHRGRGIGTALCAAQIDVSDRPLRVKLYASMHPERALARRFSGIAVQAAPPWRYEVTPELREWARAHRAAVDSPQESDAEALLDLSVRHYLDQHVAWSPADEAALRDGFASAVVPDGPEGYDARPSTVLRRDGAIVAAALVAPFDPGPPVAGHEVSVMCTHHDDPAGRADMEACLAGVIERSVDGEVLLIDSHITEQVELAMMRDVPGPQPYPGDEWMAIVALPVPGGPHPLAIPHGLVPEPARWIEEEFLPAP